jgi:hypothetical protein
MINKLYNNHGEIAIIFSENNWPEYHDNSFKDDFEERGVVIPPLFKDDYSGYSIVFSPTKYTKKEIDDGLVKIDEVVSVFFKVMKEVHFPRELEKHGYRSGRFHLNYLDIMQPPSEWFLGMSGPSML